MAFFKKDSNYEKSKEETIPKVLVQKENVSNPDLLNTKLDVKKKAEKIGVSLKMNGQNQDHEFERH